MLGEERWGDRMKEREGIRAKEYICMTHRHTQQCSDDQRERGPELSGGRQRGKGEGDICNSVNNKNKVKK